MKAARISSPAMRFAGIGLFIAVPVALVAITTLNTLQIAADINTIRVTEAQTKTFGDRLLMGRANNAQTDPATIFVTGLTKTSAIASLQQRVLDTIVSSSGKVTEITALAESVAEDDMPDQIEVATTLDINNDGLLNLLHSLEAGTPLLWVETLSVRSLPDDTRSEGRNLRVEMRVSAHWNRPMT